MNDDQLLREVGSWLAEADPEPPDAHESVRQAKARTPQVRQRGRWWPLPILNRTTSPATTDQSTDYQPEPIPAANGLSSTVTGRTQSMFSPTKAITAGALVFALGGVLLIAQPFDQQGGSVPGAATDAEAVPATWVTGDIAGASSCTSPTTEFDGAVQHAWGSECHPQIWTTSDVRLTGEATAVWNADIHVTDPDGLISVITRAYDVRNEAGGWVCRSNLVVHSSTSWWPESENGEHIMCVGDGEYDGLSAILVNSGREGRDTIVGLIFPGDAPPLPVPSAAE